MLSVAGGINEKCWEKIELKQRGGGGGGGATVKTTFDGNEMVTVQGQELKGKQPGGSGGDFQIIAFKSATTAVVDATRSGNRRGAAVAVMVGVFYCCIISSLPLSCPFPFIPESV